MSARPKAWKLAARIPALVFALLSAKSSAMQMAAPPPPPPPGPEAKDPGADANWIFESAVRVHLEAEQGGPKAEVLLRKAVSGYTRVLELRPNAVSARYNLGRAQQQLGDLDAAARSFALAASRPGSDQPFYLRQSADFLAGQGRWREAAAEYEKLVLVEPTAEEPYALLRDRWLSQPDASAQDLLECAWKLVEAGQGARAADLALSALEQGWPEFRQPELLSAVAAGLSRIPRSPRETLESTELRRLRSLAKAGVVVPGIKELFAVFGSPGDYSQPFQWWNKRDDNWAEERGMPRREAFRAVLRSIGDWYQSQGETGISDSCYRAAIDLVSEPDPTTLRRLASSYVEQGNLAAVNQLADKYADPAGALFAAKNRAYIEGKLGKILEYHRALGMIYGSIAASGQADWGDTSTPTTALFQLDRAYSTAKRLDQESGAGPTHVDADLTVLLAKGLETKATKLEAAGARAEAKQHRDRAIAVRMDAASRFDATGDRRAVDKMIDGVREEELSPADRSRIETYHHKTIPKSEPKVNYVPDKPDPAPNHGETYQNPSQVGAKAAAQVGQYQVHGKYVAAAAAVLPRTLELPANVEWYDTGIVLEQNQHLSIRASGHWTNKGSPDQGPLGYAGYVYPGTIVANASLASLVAKVGDQTFAVGESFDGQSPGSGNLFLAINDVAGTFDDNSGSLQVTIDPR